MDQGHGLLDRFMILFPNCLRPNINETEEAGRALNEVPLKCITDIFIELYELLGDNAQTYTFTTAAQVLLKEIQSEEIEIVNAAILDGKPSPKSKTFELIKRLSVCLHIFNHVASKLIAGEKPTAPEAVVPFTAVSRAQKLISYANTQKNIATSVR
jgi:hypothetical protein